MSDTLDATWKARRKPPAKPTQRLEHVANIRKPTKPLEHLEANTRTYTEPPCRKNKLTSKRHVEAQHSLTGKGSTCENSPMTARSIGSASCLGAQVFWDTFWNLKFTVCFFVSLFVCLCVAFSNLLFLFCFRLGPRSGLFRGVSTPSERRSPRWVKPHWVRLGRFLGEKNAWFYSGTREIFLIR